MLNPIDITSNYKTSEKEFILWVGKSNWYKNPLLLIEIAKEFNENKFLIICNRADEKMFKEINNDLPANCNLIEQVAIEEIEKYFAKCDFFINTSEFEGFPNTFLQAAKYGKPIISYKVDPNNFISESNCGFFANGSKSELSKMVATLISDNDAYKTKSKNCLNYIKKHDINIVGKTLEEYLNAV